MKKISILFLALVFTGVICFGSTPAKPYSDLGPGDTLTATYLMGTLNTLFNWCQMASATMDVMIASSTKIHGVSGTIVGTSDVQSLTNKTINSTNTIDGGAIKSGTVADARIASTLTRDSELAAHANMATSVHGVSGSVVGTANAQTLTNKTLDTTNTIDGGAVKSGKVCDSDKLDGINSDKFARTDINQAAYNSSRLNGQYASYYLNTSGGTSQTEVDYVNGVTSPIQTQLDGKLSISGTAANSFKFEGYTSSVFIGNPINGYIPGSYLANEKIFYYIVDQSLTVPTQSSYRVRCDTAPTNAVSANIYKNGSLVGYLQIAAGATAGYVTIISQFNLATLDYLTITAPSSVDPTLQGICFSIHAHKNY